MRPLHKLVLPGLVCFLFLSFAACAEWSGGSMRIDVEVYRGPLSQEPEVQWGELVGSVEETMRTMVEVTNFTLGVVQTQGFSSLEWDRGDKKPHSVAVDVRQLLGKIPDATSSGQGLPTTNQGMRHCGREEHCGASLFCICSKGCSSRCRVILRV